MVDVAIGEESVDSAPSSCIRPQVLVQKSVVGAANPIRGVVDQDGINADALPGVERCSGARSDALVSKESLRDVVPDRAQDLPLCRCLA